MNRRMSFELPALSDPFVSAEHFFVEFLRIGEGIGGRGMTINRRQELTQCSRGVDGIFWGKEEEAVCEMTI